MKIVVLTDVHANLLALDAALKVIRAEGYDVLFHTGDVIAIGPYPAECLDLLLSTPNVQFVMGNHESYFVDGLPGPRPAWMSEGEVHHQHWTHERLGPQLRSVLAHWPYAIAREFEGVKATFMHYALAPYGRDFMPSVRHPTASDLDQIFAALDNATLVFYGHVHLDSDVQGRARYINPGSLGCNDRAIARYCVVEFCGGRYTIEHRGIPYDDTSLFEAFEQRDVPDRQFIYRAFFGGRFPS